MIRILIALNLCLIINHDQSFAQKTEVKKIAIADSSSERIYMHVKQMPEFPGKKPELEKFINANLKYPEEALKKGVQGSVILRFVIDKKGAIKQPQVLKGIGSGCDEEALRLLSIMPLWKPGKEGGKSVNTYYNLPVKFSIKDKSLIASDMAFFNTGMRQMKGKEYSNAAASFTEALKINDKNNKSYLYRGSVYYKLNDLDKACSDWKQARDLGNKDAANFIKKYCKE